MKFSIWQVLVFVTIYAVSLVWRDELSLVLARLLGAHGFATVVVNILPLFVFWLFARGTSWLYNSHSSPIWKLARLVVVKVAHESFAFSVFRFFLGSSRLAHGFVDLASEKLRSQESDEAICLSNSGLKLESQYASGFYTRAIAYMQKSEWRKAIPDLTRAHELAPDEPIYLTQRGMSHVAVGAYQAAIDDLVLYECENRDDAKIAAARGKAFLELAEWQCAIEDFELAAKLDKNYFDPVLLLSLIQSSCPNSAYRDGTKAVENAERVCRLEDWQEWMSIGNLAAAYAELGDFQQAIQLANKAYELAPEEEKNTRLERIAQYEAGIPYRLGQDDDNHREPTRS